VSTYLLKWPMAKNEPSLVQVDVITVRPRGEKEQPWVEFSFIEGDDQGCLGGAPQNCVLTAKEADIVRKSWSDISSAYEDSRALQSSAKAVHKNILKGHKDLEDRNLNVDESRLD